MIELKVIEFNPLKSLMRQFQFNDYVKLQTKAKVILSDSGAKSEESSTFKFKL